MGRRSGEEIQAEKMAESLRASLIEELERRGLSNEFYMKQVNCYMMFYNGFLLLEKRIFEENNAKVRAGDRATIDLYAEARRLNKEMREILQFLGLKPEDKYVVVDGDDEL